MIVGGGKGAEALIRSLEKQRDNDIRICGIFDDRDDSRSPPVRRRLSEARHGLGADRVRAHRGGSTC